MAREVMPVASGSDLCRFQLWVTVRGPDGLVELGPYGFGRRREVERWLGMQMLCGIQLSDHHLVDRKAKD